MDCTVLCLFISMGITACCMFKHGSRITPFFRHGPEQVRDGCLLVSLHSKVTIMPHVTEIPQDLSDRVFGTGSLHVNDVAGDEL